jgi:peroxiredoxin
VLIPRQTTPDLDLDTLSHGRFSLSGDNPDLFTLIVFYRGLHCPICTKYLRELDRLAPEFEQRGVKPIAVSSDGRERAQAMVDKINASTMRMAYDLPLPLAREWGLYISTSRGKTSIGIEEPALFAEPGVFLVRPNRELYSAMIQTMPFVRPNFEELSQVLDFIIDKDYPGRGEYTGEV